MDPWLLSGLSNCGFIDGERGDLRARWAPHLNRRHLFESLDEARAFSEASDARVPEHAPFTPCGIQVLRGEEAISRSL